MTPESRVVTRSGKNGVFEENSGSLSKFKNCQILFVQIYKIPKPSNSKNSIKNPLKSD